MIPAIQELTAIRDRIKPAIHGGLRLSSEDTAALVRQLNTTIELVRETEDEKRIIELALQARHVGRPRLHLIRQTGAPPA
ncbi:hypothetical protein SAMN05880590_12713 [Rhizobium sp. RU35A]|uniref:hypothetical protein n=1 Tax=Rhizobium sp. RU35A TaxID=1907414 RepID=UPI000955D477|nr:hypothetical protein [Rhizobium sp. RU35A]SIR41356.1 hypothetical protein SAMN05880590_12713 [Rhizobium sp. RU35A]